MRALSNTDPWDLFMRIGYASGWRRDGCARVQRGARDFKGQLVREEIRYWNRESREEFGSFDGIAGFEQTVCAGSFQDVDFLLLRIDNPDGVAAGGEILLHFSHKLADAIGGREDLDGQVRRAPAEATAVDRINSVTPHESDIGCPNRVAAESKAGVADIHPPQPMFPNI